jgi:hypothetical protein
MHTGSAKLEWFSVSLQEVQIQNGRENITMLIYGIK